MGLWKSYGSIAVEHVRTFVLYLVELRDPPTGDVGNVVAQIIQGVGNITLQCPYLGTVVLCTVPRALVRVPPAARCDSGSSSAYAATPKQASLVISLDRSWAGTSTVQSLDQKVRYAFVACVGTRRRIKYCNLLRHSGLDYQPGHSH